MNTLRVEPAAKGLIFDIDGTLADTMPAHLEAWKEVASLYRFGFTDKMFWDWAGIPTFQIIEMINDLQGKSLDAAEITQKKEEIFLSLSSQIRPISATVDLVHAYHQQLPMSCGTGGIREVANHILEVLDLKDRFLAVVTADDVKKHKPDPETFVTCARHMGIAPSDCQVFEDGEPGLQAARAANMIATDVRPFIASA